MILNVLLALKRDQANLSLVSASRLKSFIKAKLLALPASSRSSKNVVLFENRMAFEFDLIPAYLNNCYKNLMFAPYPKLSRSGRAQGIAPTIVVGYMPLPNI